MNDDDSLRSRREPSIGTGGRGDAVHDSPARPAAASAAAPARGWERDTLEKVLLATVQEQRRARRWRIFFRLAGLGVVLLVLAASFGWLGGPDATGARRHTAVIEIDGVLESGGEVDADRVIPALRAAFKDGASAGVVLRINSPGGSPVQAGLINDEIRRLRAAHPDKPVYAVVEEICASGGYYVAVAADRIYVDKASLIGSIGVLMDGFGFTGTMEKLGVERRLLTAGENKGFLDPFSPMSEPQREHARKMIGVIHRQFIDVVKQGRGERLKDSPDLFSGLVWNGATGVELGLADEIGSLRSVARDVLKAEDLVDYTQRENIAERLAKRVGMAAGQVIARQLGIGAGAEAVRLR
ncbi:MAG TPA: S49 family peptidase [Burkholderiaceae bacterium]|nr:S49 family peptidase [Burkholderiaceae bacterium]